MKSSVVLLSSGLDSTVNLYEAVQKTKVTLVLTFDYGQRAAAQEIKYSKRTAEHLGLNHQVVELPWFRGITASALIKRDQDIPMAVDINDNEQTATSAKKVWVPNRNGVFLNVAAAFAEGLSASIVVPGFNAEEAQTFPDNSEEFLHSVSQSFKYSTRIPVEVQCYTSAMNKPEIYRRGRQLGVQFDWVWPCYFDFDSPCGRCESCLRFYRASEVSK